MLTLAFSSPHTIESLLRAALGLLEKNFSDSAQNHAEWIIQDVFGFKNRAEIYLQRGHVISENEFERAMSLVRVHAGGMPLQYVLGQTEFFSLKFHVGRGCLIPRPETEALVEKAMQYLRKLNTPRISILDIGTGSGNISVCLAKYFKLAEIRAVDISSDALKWARKNAQNHGVLSQIQFEKSDGINMLKDGCVFDLIVSNPPYVSNADFDILPEEVRNYEPLKALKAGQQGLDVIRPLVTCAPEALAESGALIFEFGGNHQTEDILEVFRNSKSYQSFQIFQDWAGKDRIAQGIRKARHA